MNQSERLWTSREVVEFFQISRSTLWRLRRAGLPCLTLPGGQLRFRRSEVLAWLGADQADPPQEDPRPDASEKIIPPGSYRCRRCGFAGDLPAPLPASRMVCRCGAVDEVERL